MPTETSLTIANRALQQAGARALIASFDEKSNEAANVKLIFDKTCRTVLARLRWNFAARQNVAIALNPVDPLPRQWRYAFKYPVGAIRMNGVFPTKASGGTVPIFGAALSSITETRGSGIPFALGNVDGSRAILTNTSTCQLAFTAAVADFDQWETLALDALEFMLASQLAIPLSGDKTLAQMLEKKAEEVFVAAAVADANEDFGVQNIPPDWVLAREDGPYFANNIFLGVTESAPLPSPQIVEVPVVETIVVEVPVPDTPDSITIQVEQF